MRRIVLFVLAATVLAIGADTWARNFREDQIPSGDAFGCIVCHDAEVGGSPRNVFGQDVEATLIGSPIEEASVDWEAVRVLDSDGDGVSNGVELGDPDGDGEVNPGAQVTRPWDPSDFPAEGDADTDADTDSDTDADTDSDTDTSDTGASEGAGCQGCDSGSSPAGAAVLGLVLLAGARRRR